MYLGDEVEVRRDPEGDHDGQIPFVAPSHAQRGMAWHGMAWHGKRDEATRGGGEDRYFSVVNHYDAR